MKLEKMAKNLILDPILTRLGQIWTLKILCVCVDFTYIGS